MELDGLDDLVPSFSWPKREFILINLVRLVQDLYEARQLFDKLLRIQLLPLWAFLDFQGSLIEEARLIVEGSFQYKHLKEFSSCRNCTNFLGITFFIYLCWSTTLRNSLLSQIDYFFWKSMLSFLLIGYKFQAELFCVSMLVSHLFCSCRFRHHCYFPAITIVAHSLLRLPHSPWYVK